jgi:hypothetical protein
MQGEEAEMEQSRILAKSSLTGMLARMGALDTSSGATFALEGLEDKYQANKKAIKSKYNTMIEDLNYAFDDKLYEMETKLSDRIYEINIDLDNSAADVRSKVAKAKYDYNKDAIKIDMDYSSKLMDYREKLKKENEKAGQDWYQQFYTTAGWRQFLTEDSAYQNEWMKNAQSWLTPSMKGSISNENVRKSATDFNTNRPFLFK